MRSALPGFYRPTDTQFKELWTKGTVVLDTNVLLNAYRYPAQARADLFAVLDSMKARLWIPHQVAMEFQRNRIETIEKQRKSLESLKQKLSESRQRIDREFLELEIERRADIDLSDYSKKGQELDKNAENAIQQALSQYPPASLDDPIRDKLDSLLEGRVGAAPTNQKYLDDLFTNGAKRYEQKRPPGFRDVQSKKDQKYVVGGLHYEAQYGDLTLWTQIIEHAKEAKLKQLMFVTADIKDDWWQINNGAKLGPQPELVHEIRSRAGVEVFWMYEVAQFLKYAKESLAIQVSDQSIQQVAGVDASANTQSISSRTKNALREMYEMAIVGPVVEWIQRKHPTASISVGDGGFPDVVTSAGLLALKEGYEITTSRTIESIVDSPKIRVDLARGLTALQEGLHGFTLVVVIDLAEIQRLATVKISHWSVFVDKAAADFPGTKIIVGAIDDGVFFPLHETRTY